MEQFKRAQVIMLPTEDKETSAIMLGVVPHHAILTKEVLNDTKDWMVFGKPQHLYITSDDEVKEGDWIIWNNKVVQAIDTVYHSVKKVIATTDTSLRIKNEIGVLGLMLPQPSQQFIEKCIESYNKDEIITEVLVEYEKYTWEWEYHPKVNPKDNTITIKKLKDSWNREEHIFNLTKYRQDYENFKKNSHFGPNQLEINEWTNNWLKENL